MSNTQINLSTAKLYRKFIIAKQGSFVKAVTQETVKSERLSSAGISAKRSKCQISSLRSCRRKLGNLSEYPIKCFNRWFKQAGVSKIMFSHSIYSFAIPKNLNFHRYIAIMETEQLVDQSDRSNQIFLSIGIYIRCTSTSKDPTQQSTEKWNQVSTTIVRPQFFFD
jgi:hypothetical protein